MTKPKPIHSAFNGAVTIYEEEKDMKKVYFLQIGIHTVKSESYRDVTNAFTKIVSEIASLEVGV